MNDKKSFFHLNGTILRTLNVIQGSRCGLKSLEFLFTGRIRHEEFEKSVEYLHLGGYVELSERDGGILTEISLSDNGIQVLRGIIADNCIEV